MKMNIQENAATFSRLKVYYTAEEAALWMRSPHPQLDGRRPEDCSLDEVDPIIARLMPY